MRVRREGLRELVPHASPWMVTRRHNQPITAARLTQAGPGRKEDKMADKKKAVTPLAHEDQGLWSRLHRLEQSLAIDKKIAAALLEKIDLAADVIHEMLEEVKQEHKERGA